jgi:hypothetical protein
VLVWLEDPTVDVEAPVVEVTVSIEETQELADDEVSEVG